MQQNTPTATSLLSHASPTTLFVLDQLLEYIKAKHLRITDVFKMIDVAKTGQIRNAVQLTQRLYEFQIVQSLEEVKQLIADLRVVRSKIDSAAPGGSKAGAFTAGSRSKARQGPGHALSFGYDEFFKALTFRRRHRINVSGKSPSTKRALTPPRGAKNSSPNQNKSNFASRLAERQRLKQERLQQLIEEKRVAVNEQQAAELEQKLREKELRRQQLTRELAVAQLEEIEENLRQNAAQEILSTLADTDAYHQHLEDRITQQFANEKQIIQQSLDTEIAQIRAIGPSGSNSKAPGQARQASISENRCMQVLAQLRDAKLKLADTAEKIEKARNKLQRNTVNNHSQQHKIRCALACLQQLLPQFAGKEVQNASEVESLLLDNSTATAGWDVGDDKSETFEEIKHRLKEIQTALPNWINISQRGADL